MAARKLYFEAVRVGDELPALAKSPIDRVQLARYAGASGDYNPVHVDEVYARSAGMPSVYAPGMLVMGMLGQLLTDWARGGQLRRYQVRFIKMVWPGDVIVCKGRVSDRHGEGGRYFVETELWAENQRGELVMKGQAAVQLFYSLEDENRQRAGQAPIVIDVPRESLLDLATATSEEDPRRVTAAVGRKTAPREKVAPKKVKEREPRQSEPSHASPEPSSPEPSSPEPSSPEPSNPELSTPEPSAERQQAEG